MKFGHSTNVFISSVTAEFEKQRETIANRLNSFVAGEFEAITQETLVDPMLYASTVRSIVENVKRSHLFIGLVGVLPGHPMDLAERQRIQSLAERFVQEHYGKELGEEWLEWQSQNLGMTYTQLEFFLANSAFKKEIRSIVFLPTTARRLSEDNDPVQGEFLKFVHKLRTGLDYRVGNERGHDSIVADAIQLCAEYALVQKAKTELPFARHLSVEEIILQGLSFVESELLRNEVSTDSYDPLYRGLFLRLDDLNVAVKSSVPLPIPATADTSKPIILGQSEEYLRCLIPTLNDLYSVSLDKQLEHLDTFRHPGTREHTAFCLAQDLNAILTAHEKRWWVTDNQRRKCQVPESFKPDAFGELPVLVHHDGRIWLKEDKEGNKNWLGMDLRAGQPVNDKPIETAESSISLHFLSRVIVPSANEASEATQFQVIVNPENSEENSAFWIVTLKLDKESSTQVVFSKLAMVNVLDLFEVERVHRDSGDFLEAITQNVGKANGGKENGRKENGRDQQEICLESIRRDGISEFDRLPLPVGLANSPGEVKLRPSHQEEGDHLITTSSGENVRFPYRCKYGFPSRDLLLTVSSGDADQGFLARLFYFSSPATRRSR